MVIELRVPTCQLEVLGAEVFSDKNISRELLQVVCTEAIQFMYGKGRQRKVS